MILNASVHVFEFLIVWVVVWFDVGLPAAGVIAGVTTDGKITRHGTASPRNGGSTFSHGFDFPRNFVPPLSSQHVHMDTGRFFGQTKQFCSYRSLLESAVKLKVILAFGGRNGHCCLIPSISKGIVHDDAVFRFIVVARNIGFRDIRMGAFVSQFHVTLGRVRIPTGKATAADIFTILAGILATITSIVTTNRRIVASVKIFVAVAVPHKGLVNARPVTLRKSIAVDFFVIVFFTIFVVTIIIVVVVFFPDGTGVETVTKGFFRLGVVVHVLTVILLGQKSQHIVTGCFGCHGTPIDTFLVEITETIGTLLLGKTDEQGLVATFFLGKVLLLAVFVVVVDWWFVVVERSPATQLQTTVTTTKVRMLFKRQVVVLFYQDTPGCGRLGQGVRVQGSEVFGGRIISTTTTKQKESW